MNDGEGEQMTEAFCRWYERPFRDVAAVAMRGKRAIMRGLSGFDNKRGQTGGERWRQDIASWTH